MTGKQKCEILKAMRREIAEANGIVYLSAECPYNDECIGHCARCDAEARYLDAELNRLAAEGKQIIVTSFDCVAFLDTVTACIEQQALTEEAKVLRMPITKLNLMVRTFNCLDRAGIITVGDLADLTRGEIMKIRNIGEKAFDEIADKLRSLGLAFEGGE